MGCQNELFADTVNCTGTLPVDLKVGGSLEFFFIMGSPFSIF